MLPDDDLMLSTCAGACQPCCIPWSQIKVNVKVQVQARSVGSLCKHTQIYSKVDPNQSIAEVALPKLYFLRPRCMNCSKLRSFSYIVAYNLYNIQSNYLEVHGIRNQYFYLATRPVKSGRTYNTTGFLLSLTSALSFCLWCPVSPVLLLQLHTLHHVFVWLFVLGKFRFAPDCIRHPPPSPRTYIVCVLERSKELTCHPQVFQLIKQADI